MKHNFHFTAWQLADCLTANNSTSACISVRPLQAVNPPLEKIKPYVCESSRRCRWRRAGVRVSDAKGCSPHNKNVLM